MCGALSSHRQPIRVKWYGVIACIVTVMEIENTVCPCVMCMKQQKRPCKTQAEPNVCVRLCEFKGVITQCGDTVARKCTKTLREILKL